LPRPTRISEGDRRRTFREDLYYRLNVFTMFVPPLRERKSTCCCSSITSSKFAREHRRSIKRISTPAIDMLASYHWPGNVRELENTLERAVVTCDGEVIHGHICRRRCRRRRPPGPSRASRSRKR
jgi:Nif-specific regulatory protein